MSNSEIIVAKAIKATKTPTQFQFCIFPLPCLLTFKRINSIYTSSYGCKYSPNNRGKRPSYTISMKIPSTHLMGFLREFRLSSLHNSEFTHEFCRKPEPASPSRAGKRHCRDLQLCPQPRRPDPALGW